MTIPIFINPAKLDDIVISLGDDNLYKLTDSGAIRVYRDISGWVNIEHPTMGLDLLDGIEGVRDLEKRFDLYFNEEDESLWNTLLFPMIRVYRLLGI